MKNHEFKVRSMEKKKIAFPKSWGSPPHTHTHTPFHFSRVFSTGPRPVSGRPPPHSASANTPQTASRCFGGGGEAYIKRTTKRALGPPGEDGAFLRGRRELLPANAAAFARLKPGERCTPALRPRASPVPRPNASPSCIPTPRPNLSQSRAPVYPDASSSRTPMHPRPNASPSCAPTHPHSNPNASQSCTPARLQSQSRAPVRPRP